MIDCGGTVHVQTCEILPQTTCVWEYRPCGQFAIAADQRYIYCPHYRTTASQILHFFPAFGLGLSRIAFATMANAATSQYRIDGIDCMLTWIVGSPRKSSSLQCGFSLCALMMRREHRKFGE